MQFSHLLKTKVKLHVNETNVSISLFITHVNTFLLRSCTRPLSPLLVPSAPSVNLNSSHPSSCHLYILLDASIKSRAHNGETHATVSLGPT